MSERDQNRYVKIRVEMESFMFGHLILEKKIEEHATIREIFNALSITHRDVVEIVFDLQSQKLTGAAAIALNGRLIQSLKGLETKIGAGDVISLVPLLSDG